MVETGVKVVVAAAEICLTGAVAEQDFGTLVSAAAQTWVAGAAGTWAAGLAAVESQPAAAAGCSVSGFQAQQTP